MKVEGLPQGSDCTALPGEAARTAYVGPLEVRSLGQGGQIVMAYPAGAVRLSSFSGSAWYTDFLHKDHLGSVRAISGAAGAVEERAVYAPYGAQRETASAAFFNDDKSWLGERYDAGAGLQYLNARYYDPELAMFLQPDWFEVMQPGVGTNRYAYGLGNPIGYRDPTGNRNDNEGDHGNGDEISSPVKDVDYPSGCSSGCRVTGTVRHYDGDRKETLGYYYPRDGAEHDPRGSGPETSTALQGIAAYMLAGQQDVTGNESIHELDFCILGVCSAHDVIAHTAAQSEAGLLAGTIHNKVNAGGGDVNLTYNTPSSASELTAGAITLKGPAKVVTNGKVSVTSGHATGKTEEFDFNSNAGRGAPLDFAVTTYGAYLDFLGGKPFDQNYYGTIHYSYLGLGRGR